MRLLLILFILVMGCAAVKAGESKDFPLPAYYQNFQAPKTPAELLEHIVLSVNGEEKIVPVGGTATFLGGDLIRLLGYKLKAVQFHGALKLNLVGFRPTNGPNMGDDSNIDIDTSLYLKEEDSKWAVDEKGSVFAVVAYTHEKKLSGVIFLKRVQPRLSHVDIQVNKQSRVMREGETLYLRETDTFKINKVVTNLTSQKDLRVKVKAKKYPGSRDQNGAKHFEIQFSRKNHIFAKVPMIIEQL